MQFGVGQVLTCYFLFKIRYYNIHNICPSCVYTLIFQRRAATGVHRPPHAGVTTLNIKLLNCTEIVAGVRKVVLRRHEAQGLQLWLELSALKTLFF